MSLDYTTRPLSDTTWLRPSGHRVDSRFTAAWSDTLELLERELGMLNARNVVIGMDVQERHLRNDGRLRADAKAASPAVELAFDTSRHGPLLYRCDLYVKPVNRWRQETDDWQHNMRAIALTLEALRAVDRHGASSSGEQYRGYKALPSGTGAIATSMTATDAAETLLRIAVGPDDSELPAAVAALRRSPRQLADTLREARAATHPDRNNGDRAQWNLVDNAAQVLLRAGWWEGTGS